MFKNKRIQLTQKKSGVFDQTSVATLEVGDGTLADPRLLEIAQVVLTTDFIACLLSELWAATKLPKGIKKMGLRGDGNEIFLLKHLQQDNLIDIDVRKSGGPYKIYMIKCNPLILSVAKRTALSLRLSKYGISLDAFTDHYIASSIDCQISGDAVSAEKWPFGLIYTTSPDVLSENGGTDRLPELINVEVNGAAALEVDYVREKANAAPVREVGINPIMLDMYHLSTHSGMFALPALTLRCRMD